jgi:thiamine-monophosphate kinase
MRADDLGEDALVARISARLSGEPGRAEVWAGDDAAVLVAPGERLVFTTDLLVEGVDFELEWCSGTDLGWKVVAVNASDAAAMGAAPRFALATLGLRPDTPVSLIDAIVDGVVAAGEHWSIEIVGGDVSGARELSLAIALLGAVHGPGPVLRSGARPGDALCVTGWLGGARAGLAALNSGEVGRDGGSGPLRELVRRQVRPHARVEEGRRLAAAGATAMIDLSDGLARDLGRLMRASGTGCVVDPRAIPVDPSLEAATRWVSDPVDAAILGGEDYELLLTIGDDHIIDARRAVEAAGTPFTRIGTVTPGAALIGDVDLQSWEDRAWQHLRAP